MGWFMVQQTDITDKWDEQKQTLKMEKEENTDQKAGIYVQTRGTPSPRAVS